MSIDIFTESMRPMIRLRTKIQNMYPPTVGLNGKRKVIKISRFNLWVKSIEEGRSARKSPHKKSGYFLSISQQAVSADITKNSAVGNTVFCNIWIMNIEINIFTVLKRDLKNVLDMELPI